MQRRRLGRLGEVSAIGFGGAAVSGEGGGYGFGLLDEDDAIGLLHRALDVGIDLFDTAPIYGFGLSEKRIGKAFRGRREDVFLVTKGGVDWDRDKRVRVDNRPETIERMLHQSLRDLETEMVDLYFLHWPDPEVDIRRPMEILARAKEVGKIRAIGLSNTYLEDIQKAREIERVDVLQGEFNLFQVYARESLFETIHAEEMGWMGWGSLDRGILTGRVDRDRVFEDPTDVRTHASWWVDVDRTPKFDAMEMMLPFLRDCGYTGLQAALGFVLQYEEVSTALCGIKGPQQLETALEALEHLPSAEVLAECERIAQHFGAQSH